MRVFLTPVGLYSHAMVRIANALARHAPEGVEIVNDKPSADVYIMYVIGHDFADWAEEIISSGKRYACVQCCLTADPTLRYSTWEWLWKHSALVYSYYDLSRYVRELDFNFYHAPLGMDDCFKHSNLNGHQRQSIITSGYVSSPRAEAIEEVWIAAGECSLPVIHIGPNKVKGIGTRPNHVTCVENIPDEQLVWYYSGAKWVAGLRHTEGFELPALEGICSGARGILFNQRDLSHWYRDHAVYINECYGDRLVERLVEVFRSEPKPVTEDERSHVMHRFDWKAICKGFWTTLLKEKKVTYG